MPLLRNTVDSLARNGVILTRTLILNEAKGKRKDLRAFPDSRRLSLGCGVVFMALQAIALTGCHSAYVNATVSNRTAAAISLVQVEYPSASFGTQTIAPGAEFKYRFKVLGSGPMKITWTDAAQHEQKATGPTLTEGTEGALGIAVAPDGVHWQPPIPAR